MKGGTIQFISTSSDSPTLTSGEIDDKGNFKLYTLKDKQKTTGAPEGQYRVTILPPQSEDHRPVRPITLPQTYTIKPGENTFPTITIPGSSR